MSESTSIHIRIAKLTLARLYDACIQRGDPAALEKLSRSSIVRWACLEAIQAHGNFLQAPSAAAQRFADCDTVASDFPHNSMPQMPQRTKPIKSEPKTFLDLIFQELPARLDKPSRSVTNKQGVTMDMWPAIKDWLTYAEPQSVPELIEIINKFKPTAELESQHLIYDTLISIAQETESSQSVR